MDKIIEKRIASRHSTNGPITLHSSILTSRDIGAHLINFSDQGICVMTDTKLTPGTTILFKASRNSYQFSKDYADSQLRSIGMVTVKWCHENSSDNKFFYTVGATCMLNF